MKTAFQIHEEVEEGASPASSLSAKDSVDPLDQVSISPTFYVQLFLYESVLAGFLYLLFGFVIFCLKNIGSKAAHKMLVKLTTVSKHPGRSRCHQTTGAETSSPIAQSPDGFLFELGRKRRRFRNAT
jgi:hypothetical protein